MQTNLDPKSVSSLDALRSPDARLMAELATLAVDGRPALQAGEAREAGRAFHCGCGGG